MVQYLFVFEGRPLTDKPSDDQSHRVSAGLPAGDERGSVRTGNTQGDRSARVLEAAGGSRLGITQSIYAALVLASLTIAAFRMLGQLSFLIILLYLSVLVACGIAGPVGRLERFGLHRSLGILLMFGIFGAMLVAIGWYALPTLIGQATSIADDLPEHLSRLKHFQERFAALQDEYPVMEQVDTRLTEVLAGVGREATSIAVAIPTAIATGIFGLTSILTFSFLFLMTSERILDTVLSVVQPRHRKTTSAALDEIGMRLGTYLRAKMIIIVICRRVDVHRSDAPRIAVRLAGRDLYRDNGGIAKDRSVDWANRDGPSADSHGLEGDRDCGDLTYCDRQYKRVPALAAH